MMIACWITRQLTDRLEMDAELCGWLAKHDGNTVYKHKKEAGGKTEIMKKKIEKLTSRNKSDVPMKQRLNALFNHSVCSL